MTQTQTPSLPWETDHIRSLTLRQYAQPGETGLADVLRRVADGVAQAEWTIQTTVEVDADVTADLFYDRMASRKFIPGGRILAGVGTEHGNLLNCFVQAATQHPRDSFEGVMELAMKLAKVSKVGGGNGTNLDDLKVRVPTRAGEYAAEIGALTLLLNENHPNAEDFFVARTQDPEWPGNPERPVRGYRVARPLLFEKGGQGELDTVTRSGGLEVEGYALDILLESENAELIEVEDSIEGIMSAAAKAIKLLLEGQNVFVDLSGLRAEGAEVKGSGGTSSGPQSFAVEIFDHFAQWAREGGVYSGAVATLRYIMAPTLRVIVQGGTRRGAGMATISVRHPEVLNFLTAKDKDRQRAEGDISTYNVSIRVDDQFMRDAELGYFTAVKGFLQNVPGKYRVEELIARGVVHHGSEADNVSAQWLLDEIGQHAHAAAEPGLMFEDTMNRYNAVAHGGDEFLIKASNPCGEIGLLVGEPCDLGAINLGAYVVNGKFDWESFRADIPVYVRFLDNVLDLNTFALEDNRVASQNFRRLGLGIMGLADALIELGLPYDSDEARAFAEQIGTVMAEEAEKASFNLGRDRGVPTKLLELGVYRRNVAVLTCAPTGTTSQIMAASGGVEPLFALTYKRRIGEEFVTMVEPAVQRALDAVGGTVEWSTGLSTDLAASPDPEVSRLAELCRTANEIPWEAHVGMQGALQRGMDSGNFKIANAISKTVNMPRTTTPQDVAGAYMLAWKEGCKGITVYVDGSYENQVLTAGTAKPDAATPEEQAEVAFFETVMPEELAPQEVLLTAAEVQARHGYERPRRLYGYTDKVTLTDADGERNTYLATVNFDQGQPRELILVAGKGGSRAHGEAEAIGRLVSLLLQSGTPVEQVHRSLDGIDAGLYGSHNQRMLRSPAGLAAMMIHDAELPAPQEPREGAAVTEPYVPVTPEQTGAFLARKTPSLGLLEGFKFPSPADIDRVAAEIRESDPRPRCPECKERMYRAEGCWKCACGNSKCG